MESEEAQKAHFDVLIASTPYIDHHESECTSQESDIRVGGNQRHRHYSKGYHHYKIGSPPTEITLFQQSAIPYQKVHVKQKVNRKDTKEKIGSNEAPNLSFGEDQVPIKVQ